jgi:hypothetical protein
VGGPRIGAGANASARSRFASQSWAAPSAPCAEHLIGWGGLGLGGCRKGTEASLRFCDACPCICVLRVRSQEREREGIVGKWGGRAHSLMWSAASAATCSEEDARIRIFLCFDQRGCLCEKIASQGSRHA